MQFHWVFSFCSIEGLRAGADGAELRRFFPVLQLAFKFSITAPGAGHAPFNAGLCDDFHQTGALAAQMIGDALVEMLGITEIMPRVFVRVIEVNQVNRAGRLHRFISLSVRGKRAGARFTGALTR
ncbi:MAG: hypothetical protein ACREA2_03640 [Blastocatellia bacterium]